MAPAAAQLCRGAAAGGGCRSWACRARGASLNAAPTGVCTLVRIDRLHVDVKVHGELQVHRRDLNQHHLGLSGVAQASHGATTSAPAATEGRSLIWAFPERRRRHVAQAGPRGVVRPASH